MGKRQQKRQTTSRPDAARLARGSIPSFILLPNAPKPIRALPSSLSKRATAENTVLQTEPRNAANTDHGCHNVGPLLQIQRWSLGIFLTLEAPEDKVQWGWTQQLFGPRGSGEMYFLNLMTAVCPGQHEIRGFQRPSRRARLLSDSRAGDTTIAAAQHAQSRRAGTGGGHTHYTQEAHTDTHPVVFTDCCIR